MIQRAHAANDKASDRSQTGTAAPELNPIRSTTPTTSNKQLLPRPPRPSYLSSAARATVSVTTNRQNALLSPPAVSAQGSEQPSQIVDRAHSPLPVDNGGGTCKLRNSNALSASAEPTPILHQAPSLADIISAPESITQYQADELQTATLDFLRKYVGH